ncbi:unnamed protein product [Medioppia subpectinata]|uniref:Uncharacterized protein n=1 Tax=Medioppia subpectinata TaxID=1979941 RepID=A0A7R9KTD7_9ACAR|nr:unnamed protein product [Medioppia subpectinata]CAG2109111.1 unnamed protein product [Medioppia subpectinata]
MVFGFRYKQILPLLLVSVIAIAVITCDESTKDSDFEEFIQRLEDTSDQSLLISAEDSTGKLDKELFGDVAGDVVVEEITGKPDKEDDGDGEVVEEEEVGKKTMNGKGKSESIDDINDEVLRKGSATHRGVNSGQSVTAEPFGKSDAEEFRRRLEEHPNVESLVESGKDTAGEDIFGDIKGDVVIEDITGKPDTDVDDGDVEEEKEKKTGSAVHKNHESDNHKKVNPEESLADKLAADSDAEKFRKRLEDDQSVESLVDKIRDSADEDIFKDNVGDVVIEDITGEPDSEDMDYEEKTANNKNSGGMAKKIVSPEEEGDVLLQQGAASAVPSIAGPTPSGGGSGLGTPGKPICGLYNRPQVSEAFRVGTDRVILMIKDDNTKKNVYYEYKFEIDISKQKLRFGQIQALDTKWQNLNQTLVDLVRHVSLWVPLGSEVLAIIYAKEDDIPQMIGFKIPATTAAVESLSPFDRLNVNRYKYTPGEDPDNMVSLFNSFPEQDLQDRMTAITNFPTDSTGALPKRDFVYYLDKAEKGQQLPPGDPGLEFKRHIMIGSTNLTNVTPPVLEWIHDIASNKCIDEKEVVTAAFTLSDAYVPKGSAYEFNIMEFSEDKYFIKTVSLDNTKVTEQLTTLHSDLIGKLFECGAPIAATVPVPPGDGGGGLTTTPKTSPQKSKGMAWWWWLIILLVIVVIVIIIYMFYVYSQKKDERSQDKEVEKAIIKSLDAPPPPKSKPSLATKSDTPPVAKTDPTLGVKSDDSATSVDLAKKTDPTLATKTDPELAKKTDPELAKKTDPELAKKTDPELATKSDEGLKTKSNEGLAAKSKSNPGE